MKVLHLIPSISPLRGGPSQAVVAMVAEQRAQGIDAAILTTNDHGPELLPNFPTGHWHQHQGVPVLAFPRWSPPIAPLREAAISLPLSRWLQRHGQDFQLLHVHALFSWVPSTGMALARHQGLPYILRPLGLLNRWSLRQSPGRKRLMLRLIDRANIRAAAALHCTSAAEADEVADLGLNPHSVVLPLGVAIGHSPAPRSPGPTRFLFLSRLHPKKQLPLLLEAFSRLVAARPQAPWRLDVAGSGEPAYLAELHARARQLGIGDRVHWHGFVAGEAKQSLLRNADWFVLPSASENFGIAAAEALAAATPVILAPGVAISDAVIAAGAGWVCKAELEPLAAQLLHCLQPPSPAMRQAAQALAQEHYSWATITHQQIALYQQILHHQAHAACASG